MQTTSPSHSPLLTEALGQSDAFLEFQERLTEAAKVDRPILLVGERGTGKELAAARLHYLSGRWKQPFITLNCAALAESVMESELFGHEAGAFTGAVARRRGRFEIADEGTLFLDEIGNTPKALQQKILRVVEYGMFERIGGDTPLLVDVRLIGATNQDLPGLARRGEFLPDLLDRLSFDVLTLPPLRHRQGDILLLADHFATRMALELGLEQSTEISPRAEEQLLHHAWPGNIRELKNVIERAVYHSGDGLIKSIDLDPFASPYRTHSGQHEPQKQPDHPAPQSAKPAPTLARPLSEQVEELKIELIRHALRKTRHNQKQAAALLGLTYNQFRNLYRKHQDTLA